MILPVESTIFPRASIVVPVDGVLGPEDTFGGAVEDDAGGERGGGVFEGGIGTSAGPAGPAGPAGSAGPAVSSDPVDGVVGGGISRCSVTRVIVRRNATISKMPIVLLI